MHYTNQNAFQHQMTILTVPNLCAHFWHSRYNQRVTRVKAEGAYSCATPGPRIYEIDILTIQFTMYDLQIMNTFVFSFSFGYTILSYIAVISFLLLVCGSLFQQYLSCTQTFVVYTNLRRVHKLLFVSSFCVFLGFKIKLFIVY